MSSPLISLIHPTARVTPSEAFPRGWRAAHDVWLERADHPERIEYVLAVHSSRWETLWEDDSVRSIRSVSSEISKGSVRLVGTAWEGFRIAKNNNRDCVVDQTNCAAAASTGKLLVGVADDYCPPEHWDTLLLQAICGPMNSRGEWPGLAALDEEVHLLCSSGATIERDRELMIAGAVTRRRYERYGWLLDPDFESMFADNWLAFVTRRDADEGLCSIIERLDICFEHRHPIFGKQVMDSVYELENRQAAYTQGQAMFLKKARGTVSVAICLTGEKFEGPIFWDRLALLMAMNADPRFLIAPIGRYSSNVYHTRMALTRDVFKGFPGVDFLLWIDDDNSLSVEQFVMLYETLVARPDLSGAVGWCWCDHNGKAKNPDGTPNPWKMSCGRQGSWDDGLPATNLTIDDLIKAKKSGTSLITSDDLAPEGFWSGFPVVLVRGDAARELGAQVFAPLVNEKFIDGFTGEDAGFFYRARVAGMKFGVDLRVESKHLKVRPLTPPKIINKNGDETGEYLPTELLASMAE